MARQYRPTYDWTEQVGSFILHPADRAAVLRELDGHIEDRMEAYIEAGLSREEAEAKAQAAMGDPTAVGKQLAALHKPWLGWLAAASKVWLLLCIAMMLVMLWQGSSAIRPLHRQAADRYAHYVEMAQAEGASIEVLPTGDGFSLGDYTVRIERAFLARQADKRHLLVEVLWTADRYHNDLGRAFKRLTITDAAGMILADQADNISYGARQTRQYFYFPLPKDTPIPLYARYTLGGITETAVICEE